MLRFPLQETGDLSEVVGDGLTIQDGVVAAITFVAFFVISRLAASVVRRVIERTDTDPQIARLAAKFVQNLLVVVGVIYTLTVLKVQIGPLLGALGITGIAIAFALTAILENVFASLVLKTRRPIKPGDQISTNDHSGTIDEINFRTVILRNYDGEKVVLPSSIVNNDAIVNHTANVTRRTVLPVGVAYDTDLAVAQDTILAAVAGVDGVLAEPAPQAWVTTFNDSSIDFDVRYWHQSDIATFFRVRSGVAMSIKAAFDEAGIEIPFPQRVLTLAEGAVPAPTDGPVPGTTD